MSAVCRPLVSILLHGAAIPRRRPARCAREAGYHRRACELVTNRMSAVSLAVLFRWKISNPALIAATAVVGLLAYPLLQPAWVMVK